MILDSKLYKKVKVIKIIQWFNKKIKIILIKILI